MAIQLKFMSYTLSKKELGVATVTGSKEVGDQIPLIVGISTSPKIVNSQAESFVCSRLSGEKSIP